MTTTFVGLLISEMVMIGFQKCKNPLIAFYRISPAVKVE